jgi:uncharacterized protein (DUF1697 family)
MTEDEKPMTKRETIRYVALLRGINVGGHRMIKKDELQAVFEGCGFTDVKTVLASGNVVFSSDQTDESALRERIEDALHDALGYRVDVMIRTVAYLQDLVALDPFGTVGPGDGHNYVAFLTRAPDRVPDLPEDLPDQYALALSLNDREFFALSRKRPDGRYGDFGPYMVKHFGKQPITTRNWKTVLKLALM